MSRENFGGWVIGQAVWAVIVLLAKEYFFYLLWFDWSLHVFHVMMIGLSKNPAGYIVWLSCQGCVINTIVIGKDKFIPFGINPHRLKLILLPSLYHYLDSFLASRMLPWIILFVIWFNYLQRNSSKIDGKYLPKTIAQSPLRGRDLANAKVCL